MNKELNIQDLLHKRILVAEKQNSYSSEKIVKEIKILEISPSNSFVKIMNDNGNKYWKHSSDIIPIEILQALNLDKPKA